VSQHSGRAVPGRNAPAGAAAAALALFTLAVFSRVLANGFIAYDDPMYLTWNEYVRGGISLRGIGWAFSTFHTGNWHPLTWVSHMADVSLFGMRAWGHHLTSLLLHALNAALLLLALVRMTGSLWRSAFAAALFALHPLRVESVAWAAERKDVLAAFFALLLLWLYAGYARRPGVLRMAALTVVLSLGLLAKPMLVSLPLLLLLLDYWPLGRVGPPTDGDRRPLLARLLPLLKEKLPLLLVAAASIPVTLASQRALGALALNETIPLEARLGNAALSLLRYIGKLLWPQELIVFYSHPGAVPVAVAAAAALLLAVTTVLVLRAARRPALAVGWFWYLTSILPVLGIVQVGRQAMADRYTYLPLIGLGLAFTWGPRWAPRCRRDRLLLSSGAAVILGALAALTWIQLGYWRNTVSLFERVVAVEPRNAMAHNMIGTGLFESGDVKGSIPRFRQALLLDPESATIRQNIGLAMRRLGKNEEAKEFFLEATRRNAAFLEPHLNLVELLTLEGDRAGVIEHLRAAARIAPGNPQLRYDLGNALDQAGDLEGAMVEYREAVRLRPASVEAHNNLGAVLATSGRTEEAAAHFRKVLLLRPDSKEARLNLERILGARR